MRGVRPFLVLLAVATTMTIAAACRGPQGDPGHDGPPGSPGSPGPTPPAYPGSGVKLEITGANIDASRNILIDYTVTDSTGVPLGTAGLALYWTVASLEYDPTFDTDEWQNYFTKPVSGAFGSTDQPTYVTGTAQYIGFGAYRITLSRQLPSTYNPASLHRIGVWVTRGTDSDDATFDFVPNGSEATAQRQLVTTDACNGCHSPISAHGGYRKKVELCVTCHTPQLFDPDSEDPSTVTQIPEDMNRLAFPTLVHRIHRGIKLPSIVAASTSGVIGQAYHVVGYQGHDSVFAETVLDSPFDTNSYPDLHGVSFPQDLRDCATCHKGGAQSNDWPQTPVTRVNCTSCHDNQWFGDPNSLPPRMLAHAGGAFSDDSQCAACHAPSAGAFDISVAGAHINPIHASALRGLDLAIVAITGTAGSNPTIQFTVKNHDDGSNVMPLTTASLSSLSANLNGPTDDYLYENLVNVNLLKVPKVQDPSTGVWTASFANRAATDPWYPNAAALTTNAKGTWAVGLEGRRTVTLTPTVKVTEGGFNPVAYWSVDGSPVSERRSVVDVNKCNQCHDLLALHGGQRMNTEYCVLCHDPTATDWARRTKLATVPKDTDLSKVVDHIEERSIDFKQLIHRVHTGVNLTSTQPFIVYGFNGSLNDFGDVEFPGDRAKCETCHKPGTYTVDHVESFNLAWPIANETNTITHAGTQKHGAGEVGIGPIRAACTGCHDTFAAKAHTEAMTYQGVETCAVCHGEQADFAVTKVHAGK